MSRLALTVALLVLLAVAVVPGATGQTPPPPCAAGARTPAFTVNGKVAPVYTTHDLLVRVKLPGDPYFSVLSYDVSGARLLPAEDEGVESVRRAIADEPGTLTASATLQTTDANGADCTVSGTGSFEVRAAERPLVTRLRRPRVYLPDRRLTWDTDFWFVVTPGPSGDRRPLTVEARAVRRASVPGSGVKSARRTFAMRASDQAEEGNARALGTCNVDTLVCPPKVQTHPRGAEVNAFAQGSGAVPKSVKVMLTLPRGYPLGPLGVRGRGRTPAGVDIKVLQGGGVIARLRIAGLCRDSGQYSLCRYRTLSTRLN